MSQTTDIDELPFAKQYTPEPYWGCPNCGGNYFGAINPRSDDEYIYACHGATVVGNPDLTTSGCGTKFRLPKEAHKQDQEDWVSDE